ncbi:MAG: hypothetical protein OXJ55_06320 [Caldilineaceae bacterium]|nr:hypothetical protein [Caldilineaceae bacterium]
MPVQRSVEEVGRLGDEIYERDIRTQVEATCQGKIVAIDIGSGDHAIGDTVLIASERLRAQRPGADVWSVRVGFRTLRDFGIFFLRPDSCIDLYPCSSSNSQHLAI